MAEETGLFQRSRRAKASGDVTVDKFLKGFNYNTRRLRINNKEDDHEYRLVINNPERIEYYEEMMFNVCDSDDQIGGGDRNPTGDIKTAGSGRYVVMKRRKEIGDVHREALRVRARNMMDGPRRDFRRGADKLGVGTEDKTKITLAAPLAAVLNETGDFDDEDN